MMKHVRYLLLISGLVSGAWSVSAQPNTLLVYGNGLINSQRLPTGNTYSYAFAPGVGYQWDKNWTAGLNLDFTQSNVNTPITSTAFGPFVRYTIPLAGPFVFYGQLNTNYIHSNLDGVRYQGVQAMLFPAIGVDLKNSFALNFAVGSISFSSQGAIGGPGTLSNFNFGIASGAGFGLSKNFGLRRRP